MIYLVIIGDSYIHATIGAANILFSLISLSYPSENGVSRQSAFKNILTYKKRHLTGFYFRHSTQAQWFLAEIKNLQILI